MIKQLRDQRERWTPRGTCVFRSHRNYTHMYVCTHREERQILGPSDAQGFLLDLCSKSLLAGLGGPTVLGLTLDVCQTSYLPAGLLLWPCLGPSDCSCLPHTCSSETNETPLGIDLTCDTSVLGFWVSGSVSHPITDGFLGLCMGKWPLSFTLCAGGNREQKED